MVCQWFAGDGSGSGARAEWAARGAAGAERGAGIYVLLVEQYARGGCGEEGSSVEPRRQAANLAGCARERARRLRGGAGRRRGASERRPWPSRHYGRPRRLPNAGLGRAWRAWPPIP